MENSEDIKYPEKYYFMDESKCDVVFIIDGQRVPALKQFLCAKSVVFRAMFSGDWKESNGQEIPIEGTTFSAFKAMIWFIYTDKLDSTIIRVRQ